ncbi:MAG: hypothetical protein GXP25_25485 [Planctomycetes bacterium]|nr:hypothetical protein [Planctomycetota bacterium]
MKRYAACLVVTVSLAITSIAQDQAISLKPEDGWKVIPGWTPLTKAKTYSHEFADGTAIIGLEIGPRDVGVVTQVRPK